MLLVFGDAKDVPETVNPIVSGTACRALLKQRYDP